MFSSHWPNHHAHTTGSPLPPPDSSQTNTTEVSGQKNLQRKETTKPAAERAPLMSLSPHLFISSHRMMTHTSMCVPCQNDVLCVSYVLRVRIWYPDVRFERFLNLAPERRKNQQNPERKERTKLKLSLLPDMADPRICTTHPYLVSIPSGFASTTKRGYSTPRAPGLALWVFQILYLSVYAESLYT